MVVSGDHGGGAGWWAQRSGLAGTVAVVTGGAGGLGAAISADLAANGVRLGVIDIDGAAASSLESSLAGHEAIVQAGDARDPEALAALFAGVDSRWGRVDTLVNVVGGTFRAPFLDTTPNGWDSLLRTNLHHVLHACSLAAPRMQAGGRGGSIINITTIEAHRAAPGFAVYAAAKAAVEQFGRTLAVELAPDRIRVNNVAPDYVPTPNLAKIRGRDLGDGGMSTPEVQRVAIPMGRGGLGTDVSGCVVFLASALSSYVTGSTLHPDGGTYASSGWFNWPGQGWANHVPGRFLDSLSPPVTVWPRDEFGQVRVMRDVNKVPARPTGRRRRRCHDFGGVATLGLNGAVSCAKPTAVTPDADDARDRCAAWARCAVRGGCAVRAAAWQVARAWQVASRVLVASVGRRWLAVASVGWRWPAAAWAGGGWRTDGAGRC